jgi:hypothetical protein
MSIIDLYAAVGRLHEECTDTKVLFSYVEIGARHESISSASTKQTHTRRAGERSKLYVEDELVEELPAWHR